MTYTPRMLSAWAEIHARVAAQDKADMIEAVAVGTNGGKKIPGILKKLRESL